MCFQYFILAATPSWGLPGEAPPFGDFLRLVNLVFSFLLVAPPFGDFHGRGIDDGSRRTLMAVEDEPGSAIPRCKQPSGKTCSQHGESLLG